MSRYTNEAEIARDALLIWDGASNPQGIARALVEMVDWYAHHKGGHPGVKGDGGAPRAPLVLVQGQLLYLLGMSLGNVHGVDMGEAQQACHRMVEEAK